MRTANAHKLGVPLATCATASFSFIISSRVDAGAFIQFYTFGVHGHVFGKSAVPYCAASPLLPHFSGRRSMCHPR